MKRFDVSTILSVWVSFILMVAGCAEVQKPKLEDPAAYYNRGLTHAFKGQLDKAISDFSKAIELNPRFALAYKGRGAVYIELGNKEKACSDWKRACKLGDCSNYEIGKARGDCK